MIKLNEQNITISRNQFIGDIIEIIPSNAIVFKTLTGIRATSLELNTARHSILLESNVPVIKDKCKKYGTKVIGVYKRAPQDLIEYLQSNVPLKKILVTPESFQLVLNTLAEMGINVYQEYFLLWDECERTVQDISYRGKIILPISDFFKFKSKAFISATAILPSDKRFEEQRFTLINIVPDFDYKQPLKVIHTNNIVTTLKKYFDESKSEKYFIFLNSTRTIASIQKALKIKKESFIFCALNSSLNLKLSDFPNCSSDLGDFSKYNFFTSRFFSAVDIAFKDEPNIVIISDLVSAAHSMIDPYSESVQIIGRFRKPVGTVKNVCHITNINPDIHHKNSDEVENYLNGLQFFYNGLSSLLSAATTLGGVEAFRESLEMLPWKKYLNADDSINHFMKDNTRFEEKVKGYYNTINSLVLAYLKCGYFDITLATERHLYNDRDRNEAERSPLKNVVKMVMSHLNKLKTLNYTLYDIYQETNILEESFPEIVKCYNSLGYQACKKLGFNLKAIQNAVKQKNKNTEKSNLGFIKVINKHFKIGYSYSSVDIKVNLNKAINKYNLFLLTANVQLLKQYFFLSDRKTIGYNDSGSDIKGYTILEAKFL